MLKEECQSSERSIAFIGSVGVPNVYGGFEGFLESCVPVLRSSYKNIYVTCDKARYKERGEYWAGAKRVFIPISANGVLSIIHDFAAFFLVFLRVKCIVVLGVSGGIFFPLFYFLCVLSRKKIIVNLDGIESRREKFSAGRQRFLYWSDKLAQRFSHAVIIDNEGLRPFLDNQICDQAVMIPYPGDHIKRVRREHRDSLGNPLFLTICRVEPENQCHMLLDAFVKANIGSYKFIGNWSNSDYGKRLKEKYGRMRGVELLDPIYDHQSLAEVRENCDVYMHGHSVGGTNPSLVEMLFYDCAIAAFDCSFNRATAGDSIEYFSDVSSLVSIISAKDRRRDSVDRSFYRSQYTREKICREYRQLIDSLL